MAGIFGASIIFFVGLVFIAIRFVESGFILISLSMIIYFLSEITEELRKINSKK